MDEWKFTYLLFLFVKLAYNKVVLSCCVNSRENYKGHLEKCEGMGLVLVLSPPQSLQDFWKWCTPTLGLGSFRGNVTMVLLF